MNREERIYSVTMTEGELRLFSEFLEQREYAGPVKMQNKALKRQVLMKKHNIPTYTSEGGRTVKIEKAGGRAKRYQDYDIRKARSLERHIPQDRQEYNYGQRDQNRRNLNINITNAEGTWNPGQVSKYKGQKHIATRSKFQKFKDFYNSFHNDPEMMGYIHGKNIKIKGLE